MGNLHLVTGYAGQEHVSAVDHAALNAALIGTGQFVLDKGNVFEAQVISNNQIRILDGELMMQGRFVRLNPGTYVDLNLENGVQGVMRNDLIVARYTKNTTNGVEEVNLAVIKGTGHAIRPSDPSVTRGDITNGEAVLNEYPLWRIKLDGLNIEKVEAMFDPFIDSLRTLPDIRFQVEQIHHEVDKKVVDFTVKMNQKISGLESYLKDEVLTGETKALYGLGDAAVPNDVFVELNNNLREAMRYIKKSASAESGVGLTLASADTKALDFTKTAVFGFANTLAEGEEIVFINGFNCTEAWGQTGNANVTYNAKVYLVINSVEHMMLSAQHTQSGSDAMESLKQLKSCNINVFAVAGTTIKAGDVVAIKIVHEQTGGTGYRASTISGVTLDVRVV